MPATFQQAFVTASLISSPSLVYFCRFEMRAAANVLIPDGDRLGWQTFVRGEIRTLDLTVIRDVKPRVDRIRHRSMVLVYKNSIISSSSYSFIETVVKRNLTSEKEKKKGERARRVK